MKRIALFTGVLLAAAIGSVLALNVAHGMGDDAKMAGKTEKCFGIAKAGKNDCGTSYSACAGTSPIR